MLRESTSLRHFAQMKVQIFRIIAVDNIPERFGEIERLRMRGRLAEVELRERKQTVHERFQLGFFGVNRLQIARPRCFVLTRLERARRFWIVVPSHPFGNSITQIRRNFETVLKRGRF